MTNSFCDVKLQSSDVAVMHGCKKPDAAFAGSVASVRVGETMAEERDWQCLWALAYTKVDCCCGWLSLYFHLALSSARALFLAVSPSRTLFSH